MTERARWAATHLQYVFADPDLLEQALTHRSASKINNERLEFLGDGLLNFVVAAELYRLRPDNSEGDLSRARAALVKKSTLAEIGRELEVDTQLILGRGELRSGGAQRGAALADTVESLVGAVFLDGGYDVAGTLVKRLFAKRFEGLPESGDLKDAKTKLQEWLQGRGMSLPVYTVEDVTGSDHKKVFAVVCKVREHAGVARGSGPSRRRAEQDAAQAMLMELSRES